ncbi:MAG TPA: hypothetical protein PLQ32_04515 [Flavihumibacter sp.]|nr:hypothetical protein [Bacteroidota bacterium]HOA39379.1 hypothetical protein [Flavihumibacter sp.]HPZ87342.1 hypothetical protein [Flavihumibacter sp.]HQD09080.1 hypothetical protein [Flavihumibacter sp.]
MFTSRAELEQYFGVDPAIAKAFVDRTVPPDNAYWRGRLLYIGRGNGFLFLPLSFDLMQKAGVNQNDLLQESLLTAIEKILDLAARYEYGEMSFAEHIAAIELFIEPISVQPALFGRLRRFFRQSLLLPKDGIGDDNPPLNRADALLYAYCLLPVSEEVINRLLRYWYALLPAFLLQDDLVDFQDDLAKKEENAVQFYGKGKEGVRNSIDDLRRRFAIVGELNPLMSKTLDASLDRYLTRPDFQYLLNH